MSISFLIFAVFLIKLVQVIKHILAGHLYLYCIYYDGVVIAAQCTATIVRSIVLPQI